MISATSGREVRQELYLNTQYEKARQDVGLFYFLDVFFTNKISAMLQITANGKLKTVLAKGSVYESLPWSVFSGRNHSLGCVLVL
jgi:hypothetical protein